MPIAPIEPVMQGNQLSLGPQTFDLTAKPVLFIDDSCPEVISKLEQIPEERRPNIIVKRGAEYHPGEGNYYLTDKAAAFPVLLVYNNQQLEGYMYEAVPPILDKMAYPKLIGSAKMLTPLISGGNNNARQAGKQINNTVVNPWEEFSFYQYVKPSEEAGYQEGLTLYETEEGPQWQPDIAGGVCKLSTILHEAVINAGLEETERHTHTQEVAYAALGQDASVSRSSGWDYRFINDTELPIKISVSVEENYLVVELYQILPQ